MEVTMISRGVEISIAGGVEETKDVYRIRLKAVLYSANLLPYTSSD